MKHGKINYVRLILSIVLAILLLFLALGIGVQFGTNIKDWTKQTLDKLKPTQAETIDFSTLNYYAIGDSITLGNVGGGQYTDKPYCTVVETLLGLNSSTNLGINGSVLANAGNKLQPMCLRYSDLENADIISIMGGTNDYNTSVPLGKVTDEDNTTFYGALKVMCQGLKDEYSSAFIFFMTPLKAKKGEVTENNAGLVNDDYRKAIFAVCAMYDIPVLDTATLCDLEMEYGAGGYKGDGIHPSGYFHEHFIAPVMADFIKQNYTPTKTV